MRGPAFAFEFDPSKLSPQSRWTLENLAIPQRVDGRDLDDVAGDLELTVRVAKRMLDVLDAEIRAQAAGAEMPELSKREVEALEAQIVRWGQVYPVVRAVVGHQRHVVVVDGANRKALLEKLELPVTYSDVEVKDMEEARSLGLTLNLARRQLNPQRMREMIRNELLRDGKRTDRAIADFLGTTHATVGKERAALVREGRLDSLTSRVRRDGRAQPVPERQAAPRREEKLTAILGALNELAKADDRAEAHARADTLIVETLKLLNVEAIAKAFEKVVSRK